MNPSDNRLIFATANPHKLEEVRAMTLGGFLVESLKDIHFTGHIPETAPELEGNALQKARYIYERYGKPCFADDTGLETAALAGEPGVYSARYAGAEGSQDEIAKANMHKLLDKLSGVSDRKARFRTVIAYVDGNGKAHLFEGVVNGKITDSPRGTEGFGYDPVFMPDGHHLTFAEMTAEQKNKISHRARAFQNFSQFMKGT
ncbi:MAG: RdgB/HAM1 family non-canonical purine NTP pyrophosphatase [Bacteroidales bacterium]|jgi:XTP/dITP diphosphohydrolase|nr:RdgB/HAM1 family non-canonical purine NTP pyrophosphatase [Bacteroidales bacterium]